MSPRHDEIAGFLARAGWQAASRLPLAGDASARRYQRLTGGTGGAGAVLMDCPPELAASTKAFLAIGAHLSGLGLSTPQVLAAEPDLGLVLLEDLGDALFARLLAHDPHREAELYAAATDVLCALAEAPLPAGVTPYGPQMAELAALPVTWYRRGGGFDPDPALAAEFAATFGRALAAVPDPGPVLILRDFHAENLIWLPERRGLARVGLLDFQDARIGHAVYDLMSLLEDARRDPAPGTIAAMRARHQPRSGLSVAEHDHAGAAMAAQRNLRILGGFSRLSLHFGKPAYIDLIPRVWRNLMADLRHPSLAPLAALVTDLLPPPDPPVLARLKALCGTVPTL